ncbi:hypothetical protein [Erysipelothrix sp. HDW6A]|uniref:hypothetical protein n=1 Tax=Erysipelothrix sp. HDW6A TaxID=2714928 RepID=UPI001F0D5DE8|nr:hypothetical protein [Erysipelothrix sp. HDW6A]
MKKINPYPYTFDNKRYQTYNYFTQTHYGTKAFKISLDAGFTCPNRDGTCGSGGCNFCSARGSGDMILKDPQLEHQIVHSEAIMRNKWPDAAGIAYFQAYTNTHAPLEDLKELYTLISMMIVSLELISLPVVIALMMIKSHTSKKWQNIKTLPLK